MVAAALSVGRTSAGILGESEAPTGGARGPAHATSSIDSPSVGEGTRIIGRMGFSKNAPGAVELPGLAAKTPRRQDMRPGEFFDSPAGRIRESLLGAYLGVP